MIGLVIVNYNDYKNTIAFVNSVKEYKSIQKIIIVDNCSTDDSYVNLEKICDSKINLIKNSSNKGYGAGINLGSKYLIDNYSVDKIIVSNTDIIVKDEKDIVKMISYLKDDVALVGPTIIEKGNVNRGWKIPSVWDDVFLNIPYIHRKLRKKLLCYKDSCYEDKTTIVEVLSGCFFAVRSDVLKQVDFFDENIFLYYEENVLGYKLKKMNYKSMVINDVSVIHNHSVTIDNSMNRVKKYKELKKSQKYFHKYYSCCSYIGTFFLNITYYIMLSCLYLIAFFDKKND